MLILKSKTSKSKKVIYGVFVLILVASIMIFSNQKLTKAAALNTVAVTLGSTSTSTATNATLTFNVVTAFTASTIVNINYDSAFTGGATLVNADIAVTGATCTASGFIAGFFTLSCGTANSGSTISIVIGGTHKLTTPATQGNYNFSVIADIGGTHTSYDNGAGLAYIGNENEVLVTAIVSPVIDLELYQTGQTSTLTNTPPNPNSCILGALTIATVSTCSYDIGFGTNSSAGVTVKVMANGLLVSGANNINDVTDGSVTAGSEEYGFRITDLGTGCGTVSPAGTYGSQQNGVPTTASNLFSNNSVCDGSSSANITQRVEVTHAASVSAATNVGSYSQVVTYTAFTN